MKQGWKELAELANLVFENELMKLSDLRASEEALTSKRGKLGEMNRQALDEFATPHPAHWHNGDFLWQSWVGKNERAIGLEQAKLRALTEMHRPKLRKAFGRKSVLEQLARRETQ